MKLVFLPEVVDDIDRKSAYVLRHRIDQDKDTLVVVRVWHGREHRG